jgi:hypothetical protein
MARSEKKGDGERHSWPVAVVVMVFPLNGHSRFDGVHKKKESCHGLSTKKWKESFLVNCKDSGGQTCRERIFLAIRFFKLESSAWALPLAWALA